MGLHAPGAVAVDGAVHVEVACLQGRGEIGAAARLHGAARLVRDPGAVELNRVGVLARVDRVEDVVAGPSGGWSNANANANSVIVTMIVCGVRPEVGGA